LHAGKERERRRRRRRRGERERERERGPNPSHKSISNLFRNNTFVGQNQNEVL